MMAGGGGRGRERAERRTGKELNSLVGMQSVWRWYLERGAAFFSAHLPHPSLPPALFLYSQAHNSADCKHGIIKARGESGEMGEGQEAAERTRAPMK